MTEDCRCVMKSDIDHMKSDILDIKATAKEQSKDMLSMRDSHTETKIYIKLIQDSQTAMSKETKSSLTSMAKEAKDNQASTIKMLQDMKDEPKEEQKKKNFAIWVFSVTYVLGTIFGLVKTIAPQLFN